MANGTPDAPVAPATSVALPSTAELANLDLIRSMAVGFVVVRHLLYIWRDPSNALFHPQALGILGVLVFFVHTSLVLMMSMDRHGKSDRPPFARGYVSFMVRRVFRIYPLSVVVVLLTFFVLVPLGLYAPHLVRTPGVLLSNLFLVQNVTHHPSVVGPLWSLPVEVQMYLFLPFLFLVAIGRGYRFLAWVVWPASVVVGIAAQRFHVIPDVFTYAPLFIPGVIAFAFMRVREHRSLPFWTLPLALVAMGVLYMALVRRFGGQFVLGYPLCLALGFLIGYVRDIPSHLTALRETAKTVAKYSYGVYLFHDPWIGFWFEHAPWLPAFLRIPAVLVATAASSVLAYHLIEAPMIRVGSRLAKRVAIV